MRLRSSTGLRSSTHARGTLVPGRASARGTKAPRGLRPRAPARSARNSPVLFPALGARREPCRARDRGVAAERAPQMPRAKRRTERDAPTAPAPKARAKILCAARRSHGPRGSVGAKPPRARVGARYGAHPQHIALALCEGRESAPEACGVPPRSEAQREIKVPGTVIGHYRPAATRAARGCSARDGQGNVGPRPARALQSARRRRPARRSSRARGRMVRRVRREESRSARCGREPGARRAACARARRPSTCTRARRWSRASRSKRRDVAGRQRGKCNPSRGVTVRRRGFSSKRNPSRLAAKGDQS